MKKSDFNARLAGLREFMNVNELPMEKVNTWCGQMLPNVFAYAVTSQRTMERNLADNGKERKTPIMHDLSIAEWCKGRKGVLDTIKDVIKERKDDVEWMAELVLCVNWKAWEHDARNNRQWSIFYSELYYYVKDLMYEWYEGDEEKVAYMYEYLD